MENQDACAQWTDKNVFAVADGMGGHKDGALASTLAMRAFSYQSDHGVAQTAQYIRRAHELVFNASWDRSGVLMDNSMGTTGVVVYIEPQHLTYLVSWCGDSRLYHFNASSQELAQVTEDHSYVQELVNQRKITPDQARAHPKKNVITHAIGLGDLKDLRVDTKRRSAQAGDILVLCTDGLSNELEHADIQQLCTQHSCMQTLAEGLVRKALDHGGRDNVTVVVVRFVEEEL